MTPKDDAALIDLGGCRRAPPDPRDGTLADAVDWRCPDLLDRFLPLSDHIAERGRLGLWPYRKVARGPIGPEIAARDDGGSPLGGLNLASQDYLGLSSHPEVVESACAAARSLGLHSAGSAALMGLGEGTRALEARVAAFLGLAQACVFPTGWAAGYGTIRALVRPRDHVVLDTLAHACLQEAAAAATPRLHRVPHLSLDALDRRLARLRAAEPDAGILVVTESLFSMDSDVPDLGALQDLCRSHRATLFVDVAHDLGAMGPDGRGQLGLQGMLGRVDVVMGSFSKTFASNGGFAASDHPGLREAVTCFAGPHLFSNALSPVQAAVVLRAFDIVDSPEGAARRARLARNAVTLRTALEAEGMEVLGRPSPIVPVLLGDAAHARFATRELLARGAVVNLVEHPAVARNACRWRLQVMADHDPARLEGFARVAAAARGLAGGWHPLVPALA